MELVGENHFYAKRISDGAEVHINQASSGRGYICIGCSRDMQAVRHKLIGYTDFFRHDAKYVEQSNKCTFSDHIYRKGVAISSLLLEKRIKVPAIRKYSPTDPNAPPMEIEPVQFRYATTVKTNLLFYEDENGEIKTAQAMPDGNNVVLFKPDVVFFNHEKQPTLLIEIVKVFKVSDGAKANLRRLGINTLQITLPKESRQAIFDSLFQTGRSKWIYTNEQQFTNYVQSAQRDFGGIEAFDDVERKLHEESVTCRVNQIANLIRSVNKCYQSEQYRETEQRLSGELLETRRLVEANRKRRDQLEIDLGAELNRQYNHQLEELAIRGSELRKEQIEFSNYKAELEKRYRAKSAELEQQKRALSIEENEIDDEELNVSNETATVETALERTGRTIAERAGDLEFEFKMCLNQLSGTTNQIRSAIVEKTTDVCDLQQRIDNLQKQFEGFGSSAEQKITDQINSIQQQEDRLPEQFKQQGVELDERFEKLRAEAVASIEREDRSGSSSISRYIKTLFDRRAELADIEQTGRLIESIKKRAYKDWIRSANL